MWQRFTERARRVVFFAQEEAGRLGENYVSTEHLLLGIVRENDSVAARILDRMGVSLRQIRSEIEGQVTRGDGPLGQDMQLTPRAKRVIDLAYAEARQLSNNYIGTEHLLLGLIREGEGLAGRVLTKLGVDLERARHEVLALQDLDSGRPPHKTEPVPRQDLNGELFHSVYERLSPEDQIALMGDGLPFNRMPEALQRCVQWMLETEFGSGKLLLDPEALIGLNVRAVEGVTLYTLAGNASFTLDFRAKGT